MAGWAPTHDATPAIRELCARIVVAQRDEIAFMQRWLREHQQDVPDADPSHFMMPGMSSMLMPGMLTQQEMAHLATLKGADFDRAFLEGMIKHHGGALTMVQELFATPGAGQESVIFAFASDVDADQRMEIDRMSAMLAKLKETQK